MILFCQEGSGACQHPNQRQKQSLSYASSLVVYWDPLQDHCWNDKVCQESLSQCQPNLSSSPKLDNSILRSLRSIRANEGVNHRFLGFETITIGIAMKFQTRMIV